MQGRERRQQGAQQDRQQNPEKRPRNPLRHFHTA